MALRAEERRGKLRKAAGSRTQAQIRGFLNGETRQGSPLPPGGETGEIPGAVRREPGELKHLSSRRKGKKNRFRE